MFSEVPYLPGTEPERSPLGGYIGEGDRYGGGRAPMPSFQLVSAGYSRCRFFLRLALYGRGSRGYKTSTNIEVNRR